MIDFLFVLFVNVLPALNLNGCQYVNLPSLNLKLVYREWQNFEDPDEMLQCAAFHQCLQSLLDLKQSSGH